MPKCIIYYLPNIISSMCSSKPFVDNSLYKEVLYPRRVFSYPPRTYLSSTLKTFPEWICPMIGNPCSYSTSTAYKYVK